MASETTLRLLVTSGDGPRECWRAVALCAQLMQREAMEQGLALDATATSNHEDPQSLLIRLTGTAPENWARRWIGTVKWTCPSPFRLHHKRTNWFVGIFVLPPESEAAALQMNDIGLEYFRAGGPGGQHQNTTDSAVRATHIPSGTSVVARDERSRHRNEAIAINRLRDRLMLVAMQKAKVGQTGEWLLHRKLERGNPVRRFTGPEFREE